MSKILPCQGCGAQEDGLCVDFPISYKKTCPCNNCIVRSTCQDMCDELGDFIEVMEQKGY